MQSLKKKPKTCHSRKHNELDFLNVDYLKARVEQLVKNIGFEIVHSNRANSKSLYIYFWVGHNKRGQVRVSDHLIECPFPQFIVEDKPLFKHRNDQFSAIIKSAVDYAHRKTFMHKQKILKKYGVHNAK